MEAFGPHQTVSRPLTLAEYMPLVKAQLPSYALKGALVGLVIGVAVRTTKTTPVKSAGLGSLLGLLFGLYVMGKTYGQGEARSL